VADPGKPVIVTAQRGGELRCRGWRQEAILRMLENVLEIGERPEDLVVYAARGKAARDWESYVRIVESLRHLGEDETLVVQSGKPVAVFPSSPDAPLVVMACGNVVGHYATAEYFDELCDRGLIMWGASPPETGSTSDSRAFSRASTSSCRRSARSTSAGRSTAGSSSPPGSAAWLGATVGHRDGRWLWHRGRDRPREVLPGAGARSPRFGDGRPRQSARLGWSREAGSVIGLVGNAASIYSEIAEKRVVPDVVTDLTAAHDAVFGYCPVDYSLEQWRECRHLDPTGVADRARRSMAIQVQAMQRLKPAVRLCSRTATTCGCRPKRLACTTPSRSTGSPRGT